MSISLTQVLLAVFLLFALSRAFLRLKSGELPLVGFFFWSFVFSLAIVVVLFPELTSIVANRFGIGRGVDIVLYVSVVVLFYLVFRLYIFLEDMQHEITKLVGRIAIENEKNNSKK